MDVCPLKTQKQKLDSKLQALKTSASLTDRWVKVACL